MPDLTYVTHCGLYCRLCGHMARMPKQARALRDSMRKEGWEDWGEHAQEGFGEFWRVLGKLAETDETCPGCRGGCGFPGCEIRVCAREREVEVCPMCEDFPCEHIHGLARSYPTLISDGMRMREIGLETWIEEQEERRDTGFAYADIRHPDPD